MTDIQAARRGRWAVAAMFLANGFTMGAWAPQIPLLLPRHGISEFTLGLLILALGLGAVGAMLFAGRLIARYGSQRVLRVFSLTIVTVLPAVVFSPGLWLLTPAMMLLGAMIGCMDVAMNANAVAVERRLGRAIMSSSHGFWSLGGFFGGALGGWLIAHWGAEGQAVWAATVAAVLVIAAMPFVMDDPPHVAAAGGTAPKATLLPRDPAIWLLGVLALFSMVPEGAVLDWAALYLQQELGADVARSGLAFAFFSGAMAVMRFAGDSVRNRFGAVRTLRWSGIIAALGMLGGAAAPTDLIAVASFAVSGLGVANMVPILFSAAGNHRGLAPGAGIAAVTMFGYSGILVAPSTIGFVAEHVGFRMTYATLAMLLVFVALMAGKTAAADGVHAVDAVAKPAE